MQSVKPKGMSRESVACAIRPKPMKPAVRVREEAEVLSWRPQKRNGAQLYSGH